MKIKKGDTVVVISGKDKGKKGKVSKALPREDRVIIDGVNIKKKHMRPRKGGEKGQILEISTPIHVSNVALEGKMRKVSKTKSSTPEPVSKVKKN